MAAIALHFDTATAMNYIYTLSQSLMHYFDDAVK